MAGTGEVMASEGESGGDLGFSPTNPSRGLVGLLRSKAGGLESKRFPEQEGSLLSEGSEAGPASPLLRSVVRGRGRAHTSQWQEYRQIHGCLSFSSISLPEGGNGISEGEWFGDRTPSLTASVTTEQVHS